MASTNVSSNAGGTSTLGNPYFQLAPVTPFVKTALVDREKNIGEDSPKNTPYRGPLSAWTKVASQGIFYNRTGFVMNGISGFDSTFGFGTGLNNSPILGYDINGQPHQLSKSTNLTFKHRPCPGVTQVEADIVNNAIRVVTVHWQCWSKEQLNYLEKFWMTPGLSVTVEWGWNNYNPSSLLSLNTAGSPYVIERGKKDGDPDVITSKGTGLAGVWSYDDLIEENISLSKCNYDCAIGIITNYSFTLNKLGGYDCTTEVTTKTGATVSARSISDSAVKIGGYTRTTANEWLKYFFPTTVTAYRNKTKNLLFVDDKSGGTDIFKHLHDDSVERRVFAGRQDNSPDQFDWDFGNSNSYYVNFYFFIDMLNLFIKDTSQKNNIPMTFLIGNSWISGHPNLKSSNGQVLLIPNKYSPTWTNDTSQNLPPTINPPISLTSENALLKQYIGTSNRNDIAKIIAAAYSTVPSFPDYEKGKGYAGQLGFLYISAGTIVDAFLNHDMVEDAVNEILQKMSAAASGIWNFEIRNIGRYGNNNSYVTIIDKNWIGFTKADTLVEQFASTYVFKVGTADSIVIDLEFKGNMPKGIVTNYLYNYDVNNASNQNATQDTSQDLSVKGVDSSGQPLVVDNLTGKGFYLNSGALKKSPSDAKTQGPTARLPAETELWFYTDSGQKYSLCELAGALKNIISNTDVIQNTGIVPGIEVSITILGIAGIKIQDYFGLEGLPDKYSKGCLFQVNNVKHSIKDNVWMTIITAGIRVAPDLLTQVLQNEANNQNSYNK